MRTGLVRLADHLQPLDLQEPFQPFGKLIERLWLAQPTPSARALAFRVRQQRRDAAQLQPDGQPLVHALRCRIERRVRTVHRDLRGDQVQEQPAGRGVGSQPLHCMKRHG